MTLLENIDSPADLRQLSIDKLQQVADEVRQHILETTSRVGGHTGASLGAVELAVALHYAFDTPTDPLVWDVGHQAYGHKILTGRRAGGPTGASLAAVELAVALHYAFDTPTDRLVWDVGHQAYAHKILTGRRDALPTIKQYDGLSGFLRRDESEDRE